MKIHQTIQKFFALAAIALSFGFAHAQTFPEHPIVLVVPNPPGGLVDFHIHPCEFDF